MNTQAAQSTMPHQTKRRRWTYGIFAAALALLIVSAIYGAVAASRARDSQMPSVALDSVTRSLRTYHQQTGHFPKNFRELDARLWNGNKSQRISTDGKSLLSPSGNYYYTLHQVDATRAGVWAVSVGTRSEEAATHFWYITPNKIERWMGPALTHDNVGVVRAVPSEEQLALLVMTKQSAADTATEPSPSHGIFSLFGY